LDSSSDPSTPLVVDVDGTLVRGDLFQEGLLRLCVSRPHRLGAFLAAFTRGRAAAKAFVAEEVVLSAETLPLDASVVELIRSAQAAGRTVVLASGAHETQVAAIAGMLGVQVAMGSDGTSNLTREQKLSGIRAHYDTFDYVGNSHADLPLWAAAERAIAVNASSGVVRRARRLRPDIVVLGTGVRWGQWLRSLRPHQWAKNALLLLPAMAAHLQWTGALALDMIRGFFAFSVAASAVYLLNDLIDLPYDRRHPTKRRRPLAAGLVGIPAAAVMVLALLGIGLLLSISLPVQFQALLGVYLAATTAYSFVLKRRVVADVMTLTTLYTLRILAGAVLTGVHLSQWFLGFAVFFFLSLALLKRVAELRNQAEASIAPTGARPYIAADIPTLTAFGAAASAGSSLVYCLYITSENVGLLYSRPEVLWVGFLLLVYWQARLWLIGGRGRMHEDPLIFALRDRVSYFALAAFLAAAFLAT
jgi:4-hydroxybenzoate polyprenyltransferase